MIEPHEIPGDGSRVVTDTEARFSRRSFLASTATVGASWLSLGAELNGAQAQTVSCGSLDRELTQGPYYLDRGILRRNITEGCPGTPLQLRLTIVDAHTCKPIENAALEIWHCDASGIYSGFTKMSPDSFGGPGGDGPRGGPSPGARPGPPPGMPDYGEGHPPPPGFLGGRRVPDDTTFCRGIQLADARGIVQFATIYPGWYVSRDTHIHLKVHVSGDAVGPRYTGGHVSHTGQLFFPDELSDEIAKLKPYRDHHAQRTRLDEDNIYGEAHSSAILLSLEPVKRDSLEAGFIATATLHIDPTTVSRERDPRGLRFPPGPRT